MFFKQALDKQLDSWIADLREHANLPVKLRLWNGSEYPLGRYDKPNVTLTVREAGALPLLLTPSLDNLGEAYVQEKIDLDGKLTDIIAGLALAVGVFPDGRGDALVALALGGVLAIAGLIAACLHSPWMPNWHGWTIGRGVWPTRDALIALATLLPVMAVAGLVRGDNAFWATRLAGVVLALSSLASIIITARGDARRQAPGLDERLATQLPLSRVISATYGGGLWLWSCVAGQEGEDAVRHPMPWVIGLLLLALLRGLIENLRWQAVLPRMPGPRTRFELQPRRYLAALLAYAVPCLGLVLASFGRGLMPITLVAAVSCMIGMATELTLYDGALAALPDSR